MTTTFNIAFAACFSTRRSLFTATIPSLCASTRLFSVHNKTGTVSTMSAAPISASPGEVTTEEQRSRSPITNQSTVLVVGASRGLGLEFVAQAAARGARVFATARTVDPLPAGLNKLCAKHDNITALLVDVTNVGESLRPVANANLTHIIHSAGVFATGELNTTTPKEMVDVFTVNAIGVFNVAQALVPHLKRVGRKLPVYGVLSSKVGSVDDNGSGGIYAYRASKSACNNIVKSLSIDLAGKVAFVLLHPGYVRTDMTGGSGFINVEESVAGMIRAVESTDLSVGFRWVDYKAHLIPW